MREAFEDSYSLQHSIIGNMADESSRSYHYTSLQVTARAKPEF